MKTDPICPSRIARTRAGVASCLLGLVLAAPISVRAQTTAAPARSAATAPGAGAGEAPTLIKPMDDELSLAFLEKPTAKVKECYEAYKAGKFDDVRKQAEDLAKAGDVNAAFILALCHQNGRGGQASLPEAERWFRQAADKNHVAARTNLALLLYQSAGQDKDRLGEAIRLFKESAAADPTRVDLVLGELYARGIGVTTDFDEADKYFDAAIKAGQTRGWLAKGLLQDGSFGFEKRKDEAKAEEYYKKGADAGLVEAMIVMGKKKLAASKGTGPLFGEGLQWLEKAGDKGNGEAYVALGMLYEEGSVVKKDVAKSFVYYQKGQALGHAPAISKVGYCYENGVGVAKDLKKAFDAYKSAADRGLPLAIYNVAVCYENGVGVEKSPTSAFRYYVLAAKSNFPVAMNETGLRYQTGTGTNEDVVAAAAWFGMATQQGNVAAMVNLARMYLQGLGVQRNVNTAVQLYSSAANQGHPVALFELAQLADAGVGGQRDVVKAHALYTAAADFKVEAAATRRDELAKVMSKDQLAASEKARQSLPQPNEGADKPKDGDTRPVTPKTTDPKTTTPKPTGPKPAGTPSTPPKTPGTTPKPAPR